MAQCKSLNPEGAFLGDILDIIDCHALSIGQDGYKYIAESNSTGLIITGVLTIFIAILGYRLMLGIRLSVAEIVTTALKIGFIFTILTSWYSYRVLIYDVIVKQPVQLSNNIIKASNLILESVDLKTNLQSIDKKILDIAFIGPGVYESSKAKNIQNNVKTFTNPASGFWDPLREEETILKARIIFLVSSIISIGGLKLISGLLLCIGPLVITCILFEATKGLFIGWLKALIAMSLALFCTSLILFIETAVLSPWLQKVLDSRTLGQNLPSFPNEIFVLVFAFSAILLMGIIFSIIATNSINWQKHINNLNNEIVNIYKKYISETHLSTTEISNSKLETTLSRAQSLSNSIEKSDRRALVFSQTQANLDSNATKTNSKDNLKSNDYKGPYSKQNLSRSKSRVSLSRKRREA